MKLYKFNHFETVMSENVEKKGRLQQPHSAARRANTKEVGEGCTYARATTKQGYFRHVQRHAAANNHQTAHTIAPDTVPVVLVSISGSQ